MANSSGKCPAGAGEYSRRGGGSSCSIAAAAACSSIITFSGPPAESLVIRIVFRLSILLRSALHWAILPNLSDSVIRVVAAKVGIDSLADSLLDESSDSDDDSRFLRFSPSILTLARS